MKTDALYIKRLLEAFDSNELNISIDKLEDVDTGLDEEITPAFVLSAKNKKLFFHINLLEDEKIVKVDNNRYGLPPSGVTQMKMRLTAKGHEFLEALSKNEVWEKINSELKDASLCTLINVSKKLAFNV